ncbi:thermonuclease family protein [Polaromonas sp.]|uniref:thermonuclease family protein n=1 Tax=Polaromonas sp. TaxID=1869339 RepID=UPI00286B572C|nr:thermonuclease family protein [Polaromonas sp.]
MSCYQLNSKQKPDNWLLRLTPLTLLTLLAVGAAGAAAARPPAGAVWRGVVSYVVDGDTVRVRPPDGGKPVSVRVEGIDAPEICQPGGAASRDALKRRALGQTVEVQSRAHDDYGRTVARLVLNGEDLGGWMVTQGQAWSYRSGWHPGPYAAQQQLAEAAGRGVFVRGQPTAPMDPRVFRKQHGSCRYAPGRS